MAINARVFTNTPRIKASVSSEKNILVTNYARNTSLSKLGDLDDVNLTSPVTDESFLVYDANNQVWNASTVIIDGGEY